MTKGGLGDAAGGPGRSKIDEKRRKIASELEVGKKKRKCVVLGGPDPSKLQYRTGGVDEIAKSASREKTSQTAPK